MANKRLTKDEYNFLTPILTRNGSTITGAEQKTINEIYARVNDLPSNKVKGTRCVPCISRRVNELNALWDQGYDG